MYQLKVNQHQSIIALHAQGWSRRRIARELGLDRGTDYRAELSNQRLPAAKVGRQKRQEVQRTFNRQVREPGWERGPAGFNSQSNIP